MKFAEIKSWKVKKKKLESRFLKIIKSVTNRHIATSKLPSKCNTFKLPMLRHVATHSQTLHPRCRGHYGDTEETSPPQSYVSTHKLQLPFTCLAPEAVPTYTYPLVSCSHKVSLLFRTELTC